MLGRAHVISSEVNSPEWWLRCRYTHVQEMISRGFSGNELDMERNLSHRVTLVMLDKVKLAGHPHVSGAVVTELDVWDSASESNRRPYGISTRGSILDTAACLTDVDWESSTTNDVNATLELFGIEAAAAVIFNELKSTISFDGTYVDPRHLEMVADTMTYRGFVMPISRHGLNSVDTGPLVQCSFEETTDVLYDAAVYGKRDDARGVTQNIMTGQMSSTGTGAFDIMMPEWSLPGTGKVDARATTLVKTSIRRRSAAAQKMVDTIEYVNVQDWQAHRPSLNMMPFLDDEPVGDNKQEQYEAVTAAPVQRRRVFVPTSPQRRVEMVRYTKGGS